MLVPLDSRSQRGSLGQSHGDEPLSATLHEMDGTEGGLRLLLREGSVAEPCPSSMMGVMLRISACQESPPRRPFGPLRIAGQPMPSGPAVPPRGVQEGQSTEVHNEAVDEAAAPHDAKDVTQLLTSCQVKIARESEHGDGTCPFQLSAESQHHLDLTLGSHRRGPGCRSHDPAGSCALWILPR